MEHKPSKSTPNTTRRSKHRRRIGMIFGIVSLPVLVFIFRDQPTARWGITRSLDYFYSNVDLFAETHEIHFGPLPKIEKDLSLPEDFQFESNNAPVSSEMGIEFGHEWLGSPKVQKFKASLPFQASQDTSVFDLSEKVRQLTEHGREELPNTETDPLQYLEFAKNRRHLTCRYFSVIYGAAARTLGYTTRILSLSKNGTRRDHAVCEVYAPEFSKWILIDPDFNIAYQKKGEWLNAAELCQEWSKVRHLVHELKRKQLIKEINNTTHIDIVELGPASSKLRHTNMRNGSQTGINLEFFEYVMYSNRNDYLSAEYPVGHPVRTREFLLRANPDLPIPKICPEAFPLTDANQLYWPVGRTRIDLLSINTARQTVATVQFSTWTPNFQAFEYRVGENDWIRAKSNRIQWELLPELNKIDVRSINAAGLKGETCSMSILPEPDASSRFQEAKPAKIYSKLQSKTVKISWQLLVTNS